MCIQVEGKNIPHGNFCLNDADYRRYLTCRVMTKSGHSSGLEREIVGKEGFGKRGGFKGSDG